MLSILFLNPVLVMFLGMAGGQGYLWARRYVLPFIAALGGVLWHLHINAPFWQPLPLTALSGILVNGYGEKSWLHKLLPPDWEDRLAYALMLAFVLSATAAINHHYLIAGLEPLFLIGAFQVRAGKICTIGKFDILIEDIFRYLTIGVCCSLSIY